MEASKRTGSAETDSTRPKKPRHPSKKRYDQKRSKTRVNIGDTFERWRQLRAQEDFRTDAELADFLMNVYLRMKSESRPERLSLQRSSSTETCESVHYEYPIMSSPNEAEQETCAAPSVQSSDDEKESDSKDATCQRLDCQDELTTKQSDNKENTDIQEDEDEEFSTSLSVGDGRYLVDLGSSSEIIVDEECILQLFNSCRECNRQCTVRKHVKGLKLVVYQTCCFCQNHHQWTNLPDDNEDTEFQINGKDTAHEQTNTAMSPNSNTS